jgi:hypothetical protein
MTYAVGAATVILLLPFLILRGRTLTNCLLVELALVILGAAWWRIGIDIDPVFLGVVLDAVLLAVVLLFIARGEHVRWSAGRAAMLALIIYGLCVPAMLQTPIDGDEPYYLLLTESLIHDHDLDLRNQYQQGTSASGRTDLQPMPGDPVGKHGEQYSRHEPFLPALMVPGYALAGLPGAIATIVLFGALLVRSTLRMMEDEGVSDRTCRLVFAFVAFGPPLIFYSIRIWPEVPAAFCFVEALRGMRQGRSRRWVPALLALVLLKLRFIFVGGLLVLRSRRTRLVALLVIPMAIFWLVSGSASSVHTWRELLPGTAAAYLRGLFGLLLDGMSGLVFQAPFYILGVIALTRWRSMPETFRTGCSASALYVFYLLPRAEWHGGWSPPLRYIAFLCPVLALGAAVLLERSEAVRAWLAPIALVTFALVVHGLAFPWRLFHIADGQNPAGEFLSLLHGSDFSRLFPSLIRPNHAALVGAVAALVVLAAAATRRVSLPAPLVAPLLAVVLCLAAIAGRQPGVRIDFEDAHVTHEGGRLFPVEYTISRFLYDGGWTLDPGNSLSFLARQGPSILRYSSKRGAMIQLAGRAYPLPPADRGAIRVELSRSGRTTLRALEGEVTLDRMEHE